MPKHISHLGLYRTGMSSPEHRNHITVARSSVLQDTLEILKSSTSRKSKHHFLFIGPRGIGKTHLLSIIADALEKDAHLAKHYALARFPEEANRILSFADFLLRLCEILRDIFPDEIGWKDLYEKLRTEEDDSIIVDHLVPRIRRCNKENQRTLIITLENLNELFTRQIKNKKDLGALRKFFMDDNGCQLIATAPLHFDAITDVDQPFYDFFDVQILDHLSEEETIQLIHLNLEWDKKKELLADFDNLRPKLRALYRMTGGLPRLTVMLYELIANDSITKVRQQFEILLDRITPFYQDRLNDLPPQERAVLETLASMRDQEKTPRSISKQMRMSQPQTSTLLKRLTDSRYINSAPNLKDKRSRLYTIREGFFDIWLAMNVSRTARARIPYLLEFFSLFYPTKEERDQKRAEQKNRLIRDNLNNDAEGTLDYLSEIGNPEERAQAKLELAHTHFQRNDSNQANAYLKEANSLQLDAMGQWIVGNAEPNSDYLLEIEHLIECWEQHRSGNLEAFSSKLVQMANEITFESFSKTKLHFLLEHFDQVDDREKRAELRIKISAILSQLGETKEAEVHLRAILEEVNESSAWFSTALNNLALLLKDLSRLEEAEPLIRKALNLAEEHSTFPPLLSNRLKNMAIILNQLSRNDEAEQFAKRAISLDENFLGYDHHSIPLGYSSLGTILCGLKKYEEAERMIRKAVKLGRKNIGKESPDVARDLSNLAVCLREQGKTKEAVVYSKQALALLTLDEENAGKPHPMKEFLSQIHAHLLMNSTKN